MISTTLWKRNMISVFRIFLIILAVLSMYTTVIFYMYNPKLADMLNDYQEALPGMMSAVGMTGIAGSLLEWAKIYLYGFLMILFPLIFTIIAVQKMVMGYIDQGSMANLLATGNTRGRIIRTQAFSLIVLLALLMAAISVIGIVSCEILFPGELEVKSYLLLNASMFMVQLAVAGIVFLAACILNEAKHFYAFGAGIPILFFLIQMLSNMGEKLENLKYVTIYTLFPAEQIVSGEGGYWLNNLALFVIAIVLFGYGMYHFTRRDLFL